MDQPDDSFANHPLIIINENPILSAAKEGLIDHERDELEAIVNTAVKTHPSLASVVPEVIKTDAPEMREPYSILVYGLQYVTEYLEIVARKSVKDQSLWEKAKIVFPDRADVLQLIEQLVPLREEFYLEAGRTLVQTAARLGISAREAASNKEYVLQAIPSSFRDKQTMQRYFDLEWRAQEYIFELASSMLGINERMNALGLRFKPAQSLLVPGTFVVPTPEAMAALKQEYAAYKTGQYKAFGLEIPKGK